MKMYNKIMTFAFIGLLALASCKKKDNVIEEPHTHDEELITTIRLVVTNSSGFNKTFSYKIDNGFTSTDPATPVIDNIVLSANTAYQVEVQVWNEAETPADDITGEVKQESHHHLFLFQSDPAGGAGSISFSNGSKDDENQPFNQTIDFHTGAAGNGTLTVTLKHEPVDKTATAPDAAGGETDAKAVFPVQLQ